MMPKAVFPPCYSDQNASHRRVQTQERVQTQSRESGLHRYSPHGNGSRKTMYTYRFDDWCATQITPAFDEFLYDVALRVAVKSPSVSQNLDTTKQAVSQRRTCSQVATPRENRRRTEKRYARFASKQGGADIVDFMPWAHVQRSHGTSTPKKGGM
jgi:hypothetical protein